MEKKNEPRDNTITDSWFKVESKSAEQRDPSAVSISIKNKDKNRFGNLVWNSNRVVLKHSDGYINASYVKGLYSGQTFVCTEGPIYTSMGDFFSTILQEGSYIVVSLCDQKEGDSSKKKVNYDRFWPKNNALNIGTICSVVPMSERKTITSIRGNTSLFEVRDFQLIPRSLEVSKHIPKNFGDPTIKITHIMFTESVYQNNVETLFPFMAYLHDQWINSKHHIDNDNFKILLHCDNGVGKTGVFLALYDIYLFMMSQRREMEEGIQEFSLSSYYREDISKMYPTETLVRMNKNKMRNPTSLCTESSSLLQQSYKKHIQRKKGEDAKPDPFNDDDEEKLLEDIKKKSRWCRYRMFFPIDEIVLYMRDQRPGMVETFDQYKFCDSVIERLVLEYNHPTVASIITTVTDGYVGCKSDKFKDITLDYGENVHGLIKRLEIYRDQFLALVSDNRTHVDALKFVEQFKTITVAFIRKTMDLSKDPSTVASLINGKETPSPNQNVSEIDLYPPSMDLVAAAAEICSSVIEVLHIPFNYAFICSIAKFTGSSIPPAPPFSDIGKMDRYSDPDQLFAEIELTLGILEKASIQDFHPMDMINFLIDINKSISVFFP